MSSILELEQHRDKLKAVVELRDLAIKLSKNRDFRKLILEEFCEKECARYAQNSANPQFSDSERADSMAIAQAAGHLKRWLSVTVQMGNQAEREILDTDAALEEARLEEAEGFAPQDQYDMVDENGAEING